MIPVAGLANGIHRPIETTGSPKEKLVPRLVHNDGTYRKGTAAKPHDLRKHGKKLRQLTQGKGT